MLCVDVSSRTYGGDVNRILIIRRMARVAFVGGPYFAGVFEIFGLEKLTFFGLLEVVFGFGRLINFMVGSKNVFFFLK